MGIQRDRVRFNVGGRVFESTATTLANAVRNSMFGAMFDNNWSLQLDGTVTEHFIDQNPNFFAVILNLLRTGELHIPANVPEKLVYRETLFYVVLDHVREAKWGQFDSNRLRLVQLMTGRVPGDDTAIRAAPDGGYCVVHVMGYSDTDIAEYLYNNKPQLDSLLNFLCKDLSKACSSMPPPVAKDRAAGEAFVPAPPRDAEVDKILRSIESMPGSPSTNMYSRDDILNRNFGDEFEDEDEDEDNDDEADFPSDLGKLVKEKQTKKKVEWKQKMRKGIEDAGEAVKKHATKVSNQFSKWWRAKKEELEKTTYKHSKAAEL